MRKFWKISILVKFSKHSISVEIFQKNFDFFENLDLIFQNFGKVANWLKISWKFRKMSIWVKFFEKLRILVKFFEKFRFWSNFRKTSILVKFSGNFDSIKILAFGRMLEKSSDFGQNLEKYRKMSILVKFSKNFGLGKNLRTISIRVKFSKNFDFFNFDFYQLFEKISILVKFLKKFRFWSKFWKISILVKILEKFRIWSYNFRKISILVKFSKKFAFGETFEKNSVLVKIWESFEKFRFCSNFRNISIAVESFQKFRFFRSQNLKSKFREKLRF